MFNFNCSYHYFQVAAVSVVGVLIISLLIVLSIVLFCLWKVVKHKGRDKELGQETPVTDCKDRVVIDLPHGDTGNTDGAVHMESDHSGHHPAGTAQAAGQDTPNHDHGGVPEPSVPQVTAPVPVSANRGNKFSRRIPQYSLKHGRKSNVGVWVPPQNPLIHSVIQDYLDRESPLATNVRHTIIQEVEILPIQVNYLERAVSIAQAVPSPVSPVNKTRPKTFKSPKPHKGQAAPGQFDASEGMHVDEMIGKEGGLIQLYGVKLTFPPGAVSTYTRITLGILWGSDYKPELKNSEALLSPVVTCGPHGLSLKKAAVLQIPHCAYKINTDWKINVLKSETSPFERPCWQSLDAPSDVTQPEIGDTHVTLHLPHFTNHTVTGEAQSGKIPAKIINLVAFAPPLQAGEDFKIRVYCVDDYSEESKRFLVS